MIGSTNIYPDYGFNVILQVGKKRQSTPPDEFRNAKKMDTVVHRKLPDDMDSASVFRKVIGRKLSCGSRDDLYSRCRMKLLSNVVQTKALQFMDLGLPAINTLNESDVLGNSDTRIQRPMYGYYFMVPDHVFDETSLEEI